MKKQLLTRILASFLSLVILLSDGSTYDHFGKDVKVAEQAFIDYIKNSFYLPWYENMPI